MIRNQNRLSSLDLSLQSVRRGKWLEREKWKEKCWEKWESAGEVLVFVSRKSPVALILTQTKHILLQVEENNTRELTGKQYSVVILSTEARDHILIIEWLRETSDAINKYFGPDWELNRSQPEKIFSILPIIKLTEPLTHSLLRYANKVAEVHPVSSLILKCLILGNSCQNIVLSKFDKMQLQRCKTAGAGGYICTALCFTWTDIKETAHPQSGAGTEDPLSRSLCWSDSIVKMSISEYFLDNAMYSPNSQWLGKWNIKEIAQTPQLLASRHSIFIKGSDLNKDLITFLLHLLNHSSFLPKVQFNGYSFIRTEPFWSVDLTRSLLRKFSTN